MSDEEDTPPPAPPPKRSPRLGYDEEHQWGEVSDVSKKKTREISLQDIQHEVKRTAKRRAPTTFALIALGVFAPATMAAAVAGVFKVIAAHERIEMIEKQLDESKAEAKEQRASFEQLRETVFDLRLEQTRCRCSR